MKTINGRIKKQCGKEPDREIGVEGRRKAWNRELMKYYAHKEAAVSPEHLKRYERLFDFAKTPERDGDGQKQEKAIGKHSRKADIFTAGELERSFNPGIYGDTELYLFYLCCLTAGLRPGEGRRLRPKQILFDKKALIVDGFIKENGIGTVYQKEGAGKHSELRIVPLPDLTLRLLKEHIERKGLKDDDFCFAGKKNPSRPITEYYVRYHMVRIIEKAGIQAQGRKLTVRSFRVTHVTFMRRELLAVTAMKLVGYTAMQMTEYHNKRGLRNPLRGLPERPRRWKNSLPD
jgi:integrase